MGDPSEPHDRRQFEITKFVKTHTFFTIYLSVVTTMILVVLLCDSF